MNSQEGMATTQGPQRNKAASTPLIVRPLTAADYEKWLPLWRGYQAFYAIEIEDSVSRTTWRRLLDPAEPMFGAASVDDAGRALGIVHWILHRSTWTKGDYCYLQDLFVASWARRRGVGRSLIEHVYETAKVADCPRVHWLTHETNKGAMLLYDGVSERSGFLQYRRLLD